MTAPREDDVLYLVMTFKPWAATMRGKPVEVEGIGCGFLPVFRSRAEAEAAFPYAPILEGSIAHIQEGEQ